jgi:hypothetical protein
MSESTSRAFFLQRPTSSLSAALSPLESMPCVLDDRGDKEVVGVPMVALVLKKDSGILQVSRPAGFD